MNLTAASGLFNFLRHKRGKQNLPTEATDALCCMVTKQGQHWQVGTPNTLQYLTEVYCKGQEISQCWLTWTLSKLGVPAPFGNRRSQNQLLEFLSSIVQVQLSPPCMSYVDVRSSAGFGLCGLRFCFFVFFCQIPPSRAESPIQVKCLLEDPSWRNGVKIKLSLQA